MSLRLKNTLFILVLLVSGMGCKAVSTEKWALKTFPIKMESVLKNVKTDGPAIVLKRKAVAGKTAIWAVDLRLLSRQKGRQMPAIQMSLHERYRMVSKESPDPKGGLAAMITLKDVRVKVTPPMPVIAKQAVKTLAGIKVAVNINDRGKFIRVDPRGDTTKKAVKHVTNLLNLLDILPDTPLRPGQSYTNSYTKRNRIVGGGVMDTRFHMKYTFKGVMQYKGKKVAVIHAVFKAEGTTMDGNSKTGSNVESKGNGSALILLDVADGSLVSAEMHLSTLNKGKINVKKDNYTFARYFETHMIVNRKK